MLGVVPAVSWTILAMLKGRGLMIETMGHRGALLALVESEQSYHTDREQDILPALLTVDEQGGQDEIVYQENQQEDSQSPPHHEDLLPVEHHFIVASCAHI